MNTKNLINADSSLHLVVYVYNPSRPESKAYFVCPVYLLDMGNLFVMCCACVGVEGGVWVSVWVCGGQGRPC